MNGKYQLVTATSMGVRITPQTSSRWASATRT